MSAPPQSQPAPVAAPRLERVRAFLSGYGLEQQTAEFLRAIDHHGLGSLSLNPGGWQVLVKHTSTEPGHDPAFHFILEDGEQSWATLWQPSMVFPDFYFHLTSPSVFLLQEKLNELGFYKTAVDGIVGARTIAAIARFQSSAGLLPTGNPNADTVYALQYRLDAMHGGDSPNQTLAGEVMYTTGSSSDGDLRLVNGVNDGDGR